MTDPTDPTDRVIRTAGQATIGGIVAGVLVAFGVVTEAQGIAVAPLVTLLASLAQNWRGLGVSTNNSAMRALPP
jgi:hypothetical protein